MEREAQMDPPPEAAEYPYDSSGVDVTLIRWMLVYDSGCYQDLLPQAEEMAIGGGIRIHVLNLETQIAVKEEIGQEKDLAALPLLRRALEESRRKHGAE